MLQRLLIFLGLMLLLTIGLQGCGPVTYFSMEARTVSGKPCLVLQTLKTTDMLSSDTHFNIYTPKNENLDEWETVVGDRLGYVFGIYKTQKQDGATSTEQLGMLHFLRSTLFDLSKTPAVQSTEVLPFKWLAETGVVLQNKTYVFGVDFGEVDETQNKSRTGMLKVASFDGLKWEVLDLKGPEVLTKAGFSLQAVEVQGVIHIFWRDAELDHSLLGGLEGRRTITGGPIMSAQFDGQKFAPAPIRIEGLPRGNTSFWSEGENVHVLIQTRAKPALSVNGPLEIWKITPAVQDKNSALSPDKNFKDKTAVLSQVSRLESIDASQHKAGLLPFIAAERLVFNGREFIVRSNWQLFEIWRREPEAGWRLISTRPRGIPVYDMESRLLAALALCVAAVVFGAGLAYHRRKHAQSLVRKVQANDLYATLGLRSLAYAIDVALVIAVVFFFETQLQRPFVAPLSMLAISLEQMPHWSFFAGYMAYFVLAEWLLGATLGKMIMGLRVVMDGGNRLSFWSALVRNLIGFYERSPVVVFIAVLMMIFGPRRQRMGDLMSRTYVVQKGALDVFKKQRAADKALRGTADGASIDALPSVENWSIGKEKDTAGQDKK